MTSEALTTSLRVFFARMAARGEWAAPWIARDARGRILGWQVAANGGALRRRFAMAQLRQERHAADPRPHVATLPVADESL